MTNCEKTLSVIETSKTIPCSRSHVYRLLDSGDLRGFRIGNKKGVRVIESSITEYIEKQKNLYSEGN